MSNIKFQDLKVWIPKTDVEAHFYRKSIIAIGGAAFISRLSGASALAEFSKISITENHAEGWFSGTIRLAGEDQQAFCDLIPIRFAITTPEQSKQSKVVWAIDSVPGIYDFQWGFIESLPMQEPLDAYPCHPNYMDKLMGTLYQAQLESFVSHERFRDCVRQSTYNANLFRPKVLVILRMESWAVSGFIPPSSEIAPVDLYLPVPALEKPLEVASQADYDRAAFKLFGFLDRALHFAVSQDRDPLNSERL